MFAEYLAGTDLLVWPLVALAIFFTVFVGVLVQVTVSWRRPGTLAELDRLPLQDDDRPRTPHGESRE
jgi:hypothetical protein